MRVLVTGSAGHLGEALMLTLERSDHEAIGLDIRRSPVTHRVGSITERDFVRRCMQGVDAVLHTATLHKPHIVTHSRQAFIDTNISTGLPCIILRTSRFFPEEDDDAGVRETFDAANLKANELLYRRADLEDIVSAHRLAMEQAPAIGFGRYIISATTPFTPADLQQLRAAAPAVVRRYSPGYEAEYHRRGWSMVPTIDRVYVNELARARLGWQP